MARENGLPIRNQQTQGWRVSLKHIQTTSGIGKAMPGVTEDET
jgi:hypothetical protein